MEIFEPFMGIGQSKRFIKLLLGHFLTRLMLISHIGKKVCAAPNLPV